MKIIKTHFLNISQAIKMEGKLKIKYKKMNRNEKAEKRVLSLTWVRVRMMKNMKIEFKNET